MHQLTGIMEKFYFCLFLQQRAKVNILVPNNPTGESPAGQVTGGEIPHFLVIFQTSSHSPDIKQKISAFVVLIL